MDYTRTPVLCLSNWKLELSINCQPSGFAVKRVLAWLIPAGFISVVDPDPSWICIQELSVSGSVFPIQQHRTEAPLPLPPPGPTPRGKGLRMRQPSQLTEPLPLTHQLPARFPAGPSSPPTPYSARQAGLNSIKRQKPLKVVTSFFCQPSSHLINCVLDPESYQDGSGFFRRSGNGF